MSNTGMTVSETQKTADLRGQKPAGRYRWSICALLFSATTINYIDRQVLGILKPTLTEIFNWSDERIYATIIFSFQFAYAIGLMLRAASWIGSAHGAVSHWP